MTAIILAAGYGTRLYPLTLDKPKALLKVGEKTILERLVAKISKIKGVREIVIVTNEKFHRTFDEWASGSAGSVPVFVINDRTLSNKTRLGAIGDITSPLRKKI